MDGSGQHPTDGGSSTQSAPDASVHQTRHDQAKNEEKATTILITGKNQFGRQQLGRAMARRVLQAWAVARSGDLPAPRTHRKDSPWSPQAPPALRFLGKWRRLEILFALGFCMHLRIVDKIEDVGATVYRGFDP